MVANYSLAIVFHFEKVTYAQIRCSKLDTDLHFGRYYPLLILKFVTKIINLTSLDIFRISLLYYFMPLLLFHNFSISFFSSSGIHKSHHLNGCHAIIINSLSISLLYVLHYLYSLHQIIRLSKSTLSRLVFSRSLSILGVTNQSGTYLNADRKL